MITEDYVSFETAKLLKEKGFNEPCNMAYCETNNGYELKNDVGHTNLMFIAFRIQSGVMNYSAPTLQMVMKWIQEIHNIIIVADYEYEFTDTSWYFKVYRLGDNGKPERVPIKGISYDNFGEHEHIVGYRDYERSYKDYATKEEACEAGIRYVLENLI